MVYPLPLAFVMASSTGPSFFMDKVYVCEVGTVWLQTPEWQIEKIR